MLEKRRGGGCQRDLKMTRRLPPQIKRTPPAAVTFRESLCHLRGPHNWLPGQTGRGAAGDSSATGYTFGVHLHITGTKNATPKLPLLHTNAQRLNLCGRILLSHRCAAQSSTSAHSSTAGSGSSRQPSCGRNCCANTHHFQREKHLPQWRNTL